MSNGEQYNGYSINVVSVGSTEVSRCCFVLGISKPFVFTYMVRVWFYKNGATP